MTQILGLLTPDYVMLASDRLLTWQGGPNDGRVFRDEECKLVCVNNLAGIGYTGLARLGGRPAHEWIGVTLATANCRRPRDAVEALAAHAPTAVRQVARHLRGLTFLTAGWDWFDDPPVLRPHFALVSNTFDGTGQRLSTPVDSFTVHVRLLKADEGFAWHSVGQPLVTERAQALDRNLRRLVQRSIGPKEALRYLVEEIQFTSESASSVGDRILAMCIPVSSVKQTLSTGHSMMLASLPDPQVSTFSYFDPTHNDFCQFGPTYVSGQMATTDVETESRPEENFQSSSMRILHLPPKTT